MKGFLLIDAHTGAVEDTVKAVAHDAVTAGELRSLIRYMDHDAPIVIAYQDGDETHYLAPDIESATYYATMGEYYTPKED